MSAEGDGPPEAKWSPGDPAREKRWRVTCRVAWTAGVVAVFAAQATRSDHTMAFGFLAIAFLAMGIGFGAGIGQRKHSPAPEVVGPELARYKGQVFVGGATNSVPVWLVFDDRALHLLGRSSTPDNATIPYEDIACAQLVHLTMVLMPRQVVFVVCGDGTARRVAAKNLPGVLDILRAHDVVIHDDLTVNGFALQFGRVKALDVSRHASCLGAETAASVDAVPTIEQVEQVE